jgi:hypothetical protein
MQKIKSHSVKKIRKECSEKNPTKHKQKGLLIKTLQSTSRKDCSITPFKAKANRFWFQQALRKAYTTKNLFIFYAFFIPFPSL